MSLSPFAYCAPGVASGLPSHVANNRLPSSNAQNAFGGVSRQIDNRRTGLGGPHFGAKSPPDRFVYSSSTGVTRTGRPRKVARWAFYSAAAALLAGRLLPAFGIMVPEVPVTGELDRVNHAYTQTAQPDGSLLIQNDRLARQDRIAAGMLAQTQAASGKVLADGGHGSGVFLKDRRGDLYVLTNHHVVEVTSGNPDPNLFIIEPFKQLFPVYGRLVATTEDPDLALLKVEAHPLDPVLEQALKDWAAESADPQSSLPAGGQPSGDDLISALKPIDTTHLGGSAQPNDFIYLVGNPELEQDRLLPGQILAPEEGEYMAYATDCRPGTSGSPVFDEQGNIVALNRAQLWTSSFPYTRVLDACEGINAKTLTAWLKDHGVAV